MSQGKIEGSRLLAVPRGCPAGEHVTCEWTRLKRRRRFPPLSSFFLSSPTKPWLTDKGDVEWESSETVSLQERNYNYESPPYELRESICRQWLIVLFSFASWALILFFSTTDNYWRSQSWEDLQVLRAERCLLPRRSTRFTGVLRQRRFWIGPQKQTY